ESAPALPAKTAPGPVEESVKAAPALGVGGGIAEPTAIDSPARALFTSATTPEELVKLQTPVVGSTQDFRNITLASRLSTPPAPEARAFTLSTKHDVALGVFKLKTDLGMNIDALKVPIRTVGQDGIIKAGDVAFKDMNDQVLTQILTEALPANADEATFLTSGIELLEHSVVVLRGVE